jgi:hypothetical protein
MRKAEEIVVEGEEERYARRTTNFFLLSHFNMHVIRFPRHSADFLFVD